MVLVAFCRRRVTVAVIVTLAVTGCGNHERVCTMILKGSAITVDATAFASSHPTSATVCVNGDCRNNTDPTLLPVSDGRQVDVRVEVRDRIGTVLVNASTPVRPKRGHSGCPSDKAYTATVTLTSQGELRASS